MKKIFTLFVLTLTTFDLFAQVPQKVSYQCVIRNAIGALVINQGVGMRVSILQGASNGTVVYQETFNPNPQTNSNGLVSIEIGGGTSVTGTFAAIDWSNGTYYIKTETDPVGGSNYTITGTSQILSVPYALYAKTAGNGFSGNYNDLINKPAGVSAFTNDAGYLTTISIPDQAVGDIIYFDGTKWTRLPQGTDGQILTVQSGFPVWRNIFIIPNVMPPTVFAQDASNILMNSATLNGSVNANDFSTIVNFEYGLTTSYGKSIIGIPSPITGISTTNVSALIDDLSANTIYHFRLKASNAVDLSFSNDISFTTIGAPPAATTNLATNITPMTSTLNGNIDANGFSSIVTFEYGTTMSYGSTITAAQSPVTGDSPTNISVNINGLSASTTYHFRVKAENSLGITYGNDLTFKTLGQAPTAKTQFASNLQTTSATLNATLNANRLSTVVKFEYGYTSSYGSTITAIQSPITDSLDMSVTAKISGLEINTTYHFRVIAINSLGTTYGDDATFITVPLTINDVEGNTYDVIGIDRQVWMAENLKTTNYNNGDAIQNVTEDAAWSELTTGAYCWYNNILTYNKDTYGALYNWYSVNTGLLCPTGWHVPTRDEWLKLSDYLGGGMIAGGKLKETGTSHWNSPNEGATNEVGFTALPGGKRSEGGRFMSLRDHGYWFTATIEANVFHFFQIYANSIIFADYKRTDYKSGHSIRCIRD